MTLEERQMELNERKQALDESFAKKWAPIFFGGLTTFIISLITLVTGYVSQHAATQATIQERIREDTRQSIATAREAFNLYLTQYKPDQDDKRNLYHLKLFAVISNNDAVKEIFQEMRESALQEYVKDDRSKITEANEELPSISNVQMNASLPQNFTIYIQYAQNANGVNFKGEAEKLQEKLRQAGFKVPGIDAVSTAPNSNSILYYNSKQKDDIGSILKHAMGDSSESFKERVITGHKLPADIFEIWIGRSS